MSVRRACVAGGGLAALALTELATRALVYALAPPSADLADLRAAAGGPQPVIVAAVVIAASVGLSAAVIALAALGARERWALSDPFARGPAPRLRLAPVARRWAGLWVATLAVFVAVESYIHWRAGLGFHGLSCLFGPVHVNAIPVAAGLSLVVAASATGIGHLVRWMRRVVRLLRAPRRRRRARQLDPPRPRPVRLPARASLIAALRPRPPPLLQGL